MRIYLGYNKKHMGIFNFFSDNILSSDISGFTVRLVEELKTLEKSRERDFVEALVRLSSPKVSSNFSILMDLDKKFRGLYSKLGEKEKKELALMTISYYYVRFSREDDFFDSYSIDQNKIKDIIFQLFKIILENKKYIIFFESNTDGWESHGFCYENFARIIDESQPEKIIGSNLGVSLSLSFLNADIDKIVMIEIIKCFSKIDPGDLIKENERK